MEILVRFITCCVINLKFYLRFYLRSEMSNGKMKEKIGTFLLYSYFFLYNLNASYKNHVHGRGVHRVARQSSRLPWQKNRNVCIPTSASSRVFLCPNKKVLFCFRRILYLISLQLCEIIECCSNLKKFCPVFRREFVPFCTNFIVLYRNQKFCSISESVLLLILLQRCRTHRVLFQI